MRRLLSLAIAGPLLAAGSSHGTRLLLLLAAACAPREYSSFRATPFGLAAYYPTPIDNPVTTAKADLGRRLFFDPRLSADRSLACASCHQPARGFSDSSPRSRGVFGRTTTRNAPSLVNVAYAASLSWDGRSATLEEQVLRPIENPLELGLPLPELIHRIAAERSYRRAFRRVFGGPVTEQGIANALASYLRTLRFGAAPLDRSRFGDSTALPAPTRTGLRVFLTRGNCTACHLGPTLTDEQFHNTGVSWGGGDIGRTAVTDQDKDRGRFSTPSLRAVGCTAPFMHDGSLASLEEVVDFYDRGGNPNPNLDEEIRPLRLTANEKTALVRFLRTLRSGCQGAG